MEIGPRDSFYSKGKPSKSIDLLVTNKTHQQMPHRVIEPPDVQCSNLLSTEQNISYSWKCMLLLVLKNEKKIPNGKYMENFLKPWFIDNIYFANKFWVKFNFRKIQVATNWICFLAKYQLNSTFMLRNCKIKVQN